MVNYSSDALDATFGALADPTRRAILARLSEGQASVKSLAKPFDMSLPAVSKHLRVLEAAGLLRREIDGRVHRCRLGAGPMRDAARWIAHYQAFWEAQLDALGKFLESTNEEKNPCPAANHKPRTRPTRSNSAAPSPRRSRKSSPPGPDRTS